MLRFVEPEVGKAYLASQHAFFKKAAPAAAVMVIAASIAIEITIRFSKQAIPGPATSAFDWTVAGLLVVLCIANRFFYSLHTMVCPLLTIFIYFYMCIVS
jgi:hypothetical protein